MAKNSRKFSWRILDCLLYLGASLSLIAMMPYLVIILISYLAIVSGIGEMIVAFDGHSHLLGVKHQH